MLALSLMACSLTGPKSSADAPFDIGRFESQRWIVDPRNDEENGIGILLLSTEAVGCGQLSTAGDDLEDLIASGEGLLFMLDYYGYGDQAPGGGWTGLWMGGSAYSPQKGDRYMRSIAFSDSFFYFLDGYYAAYFGSTTWINVEDDSDGLSGTFQTSYWSGKFDADSCGEWEVEVRDTGHTGDTYWDTW